MQQFLRYDLNIRFGAPAQIEHDSPHSNSHKRTTHSQGEAPRRSRKLSRGRWTVRAGRPSTQPMWSPIACRELDTRAARDQAQTPLTLPVRPLHPDMSAASVPSRTLPDLIRASTPPQRKQCAPLSPVLLICALKRLVKIRCDSV